jgi:hypothetical protein
MGIVSKCKTALRNPDKIQPYLVEHIFRMWGYINWEILDKGVDVMDSDWDNLIILDACRYDDFENQFVEFELEGQLTKVISNGSASEQFLRKNFDREKFPDTVIVSSNGFLSRINAEFYAVYRQYENKEYKKPYFPELDGADLQTTHPEKTVELAKKAHFENPNKRIIIHFYPPHVPHYTPIAKEMRKKGMDVREALKNGDLSIEKGRQSYRENLDCVLRYTEELVQYLPGKTVITADHGNLFGEYGLLMHPGKTYVPELVQVPWLEIESENRKQIKTGDKTESTGEMTVDIKESLRDLGYIDI